MNNKLIKQQISSLLETLQEQYDAIKNNEEQIPRIEIDILLNNTRQLYEALLQLNKAGSAEIVLSKAEPAIDIKTPEKVIEIKAEKAITEEIIDEPKLKYDEVEAVSEITKQQTVTVEKPVREENITTVVEQKIVEERAKVISKTTKPSLKSGNLFEEVAVIADKFEEKITIHDKISKTKEDKSWAEKLQNLPLQDLKKSIGINEKFKFVNELFDGSLQNYNESIDFLSNCKAFAEAENYLKQILAPKYDWKKESGVYQSLLFLVQRKFNS